MTTYLPSQPDQGESDDPALASPSTSQPSCSQSTESTVTLSSPSQDSLANTGLTPMKANVKCQTNEVIFMSKEEQEELIHKAAENIDIKGDLEKLKKFFLAYDPQPAVMDPEQFQHMCTQAGAANLFSTLYNAMSSYRMSDERQKLTKVRVMVVIYIMIYSQSQRGNWFQVSLARTLQQFGISQQGLESLRNLGIVAHPRTIKASMHVSSASHLDRVKGFFETAIENEQFVIFCIDDYHNIHTKHRPETKTQTQSVHTSTLLVKVFPNIKAVLSDPHQPLLPVNPVDEKLCKKLIDENIGNISHTYASNMPDWVVAKYFDPEAERQRLAIHDYQQTEIREMRNMDNTKLVDSLNLPLKSYNDVLTAFNHMLANGLENYLNHYAAPFPADWPMQFFMRQLIYNTNLVSLPDVCKNVAPLIGPLHISLNSRECVLLNFHQIFADLYSFLFGAKAKLAKKPKPWRLSLLLEVMYGGWTLVRDTIMSVFLNCKDIEFLTLINLIDNYVPLVLSIYSVVLKCSDYGLYCKSLFRCWVMMMIFHRRHYNKALLVALSTLKYWHENTHPMHLVIQQFLAAFDEYPVENFHSVLRARTKETDTAEQICEKAKEIDACKKDMQEFQLSFVPSRKFNFSRKRIDSLKTRAAEFLVKKFEAIHSHPGMASQQPRQQRQPKYVTKWHLPNLFGTQVVTNKVLPLGFSTVERSPNPNK